MASNAPIGVFDSGIGGLTVYAAIKRVLPGESIVYLGDTARVPYGTKSDETVVSYALEDAAFLEERGVKAVVVACNTASALALPALCERCSVPVIGVVEPGARAALAASVSRRVGIVGTEATVASGAYERELRKRDASVRPTAAACSLFVPLVEEGWTDGDIPRAVASRYLKGLSDECIDTLILGCTHYPLLKGVIGQVMGDDVVLVDSGEATAKELERLLVEEGLGADSSADIVDRIFVTDVPTRFEEVAHRFLEGCLPAVTRVHF